MPTAQDRDEQDAQDPFDRNPLADHGYRVGTRLARPRDRRPQLVSAGLALAIVGAVVLAALQVRLPDVAVAPSRGPRASGALAAIPTQLPAMQRFDVAAAGGLTPIPVYSGGLRWLDPRAGSISGPAFSGARGWIFAGSDGGAWCVCYDAPWSSTGTIERTTISHYDPTGEQLSRTTVDEAKSDQKSSDAIERDAARSADGRYLYVAAAIRDVAGWTVQLDQVDLIGTPRLLDAIELGRIGLSAEGTTLFEPVVRVAPDGRTVRVAVPFLDRAALGQTVWPRESVWLVRPSFGLPSETGGAAISQIEDRIPVVQPDCQAQAWVSADVYARLCEQTASDRHIPIAMLDRLDGTWASVQVGDPVGTNDLEWLVDGSTGVVYRWSPFSHVLARLDVATGEVTQRVDLGLAPAAAQPDTAVPTPRSGRAAWQPIVSAESAATARLTGSIDGSLLYAIGATGSIDGAGPSGPLYASTGIFVFDAASLGLVAHWPAAAMYDQIGVSPDGRDVLAVGLEGMTQDGRIADWPATLTIHDAADGHPIEQLSQLGGDEGFFVDLLAPGPVP